MRYDNPKIIKWCKTHKGLDVCKFTSCEYCNKVVPRTKRTISNSQVPSRQVEYIFCNQSCARRFDDPPILFNCATCGKQVQRKQSIINKTKSGNFFCNHSCGTKYANANKTTGTTRSKLETFLENKIKITFPNLIVMTNNVSILKAELDLYLPELNLAFEINGLFHYCPIFGIDKLKRTQNRDILKQVLCAEAAINLCVINSSDMKTFKEAYAMRYWEVVKEVITTTSQYLT